MNQATASLLLASLPLPQRAASAMAQKGPATALRKMYQDLAGWSRYSCMRWHCFRVPVLTLFWWRFVGKIGLEQDTIKMNGQRFSDFTTRAQGVIIVRRLLVLELRSRGNAKKAKEIHKASFLLLLLAWVFFFFRSAQCLFPLLFSLFVSSPSMPHHIVT